MNEAENGKEIVEMTAKEVPSVSRNSGKRKLRMTGQLNRSLPGEVAGLVALPGNPSKVDSSKKKAKRKAVRKARRKNRK